MLKHNRQSIELNSLWQQQYKETILRRSPFSTQSSANWTGSQHRVAFPAPSQKQEMLATHQWTSELHHHVMYFFSLFLRFPLWLWKQSAASFYRLQTQLMKLICWAAALWCHISSEALRASLVGFKAAAAQILLEYSHRLPGHLVTSDTSQPGRGLDVSWVCRSVDGEWLELPIKTSVEAGSW